MVEVTAIVYLLIKKKGQGQLSGDRLFSERPETTVLFNANISGFASLWPVVFIFQIVRKILKFKGDFETFCLLEICNYFSGRDHQQRFPTCKHQGLREVAIAIILMHASIVSKHAVFSRGRVKLPTDFSYALRCTIELFD